MVNQQDIDDENQAREALQEIAQDIVDRCAVISHWGGDESYDGVFESLRRRVEEIEAARNSSRNSSVGPPTTQAVGEH